MNSNLSRALTAAFVALGGVTSALAQYDNGQFCYDPNNTAPYSADFATYHQRTQLFGAELGVSGTVTYVSPVPCYGGGPVRGRIGFTMGTRGSYQDDDPNQTGQYLSASGGPAHDNYLELTHGANFENTLTPGGYFAQEAPPGGQSYARVYVTRTPSGGTPTTTSYLFGNNAFTYAYVGRSGRYMLAEGNVTTGLDVRLVIDVLGDAAKLTWTINDSIDTTDTVAAGLYFGQNVRLLDEDATIQGVTWGIGGVEQEFYIPYVTIPGRRPLTEQERFNSSGLAPDGTANGATIGVPPYVNFTENQTAGFGLQVINDPSALTGFDPTSGSDQTPVDEFVVGESPFLIDGTYSATDPQFGDFIFNAPGNGNADSAPLDGGGDVAYLQKWTPTTVTNGSSRTIVAYYRAVNFDPSYAANGFLGYSVSVDTPRAISTNANTITSDNPYTPNPFTIRVNVDNTGGFSNASTPVPLQSTTVTLSLPAGLSNPADNSRVITRTIPLVNITDIQYVDFQVQVDPNVSGAQTYSVTVAPQSGGFQPKTITGTINIAASPRLYLRSGANLVSPPWQFNDSSWESVLGLSLNSDFQSYTWDALRQQYVAQLNAQRGVGTWIISNSELGYTPLSGSPKQPDDEFPDPSNYDIVQGAGSPTVLLHTGWNLVGNPYNYAFPIGNLVGIPVGGSQAIGFADLVNQNYTNGQFAFYDQTNRSYSFLSSSAQTPLPPNNGYWIYANTDFYLQFPPLFELFLRSAPGTIDTQRSNNWKLQLRATSATAVDSDNYVGVAPDGTTARKNSARKPPVQLSAGKADVLNAYVTGDGGASMAKAIRVASGAQTYTFNVLSKAGGPVTVSWPNLKAIPSNLTVKVTDPAKKKTIDARTTSGYTVTAKAATAYPLTVTVAPVPIPPEKITTSSYSYVLVNGVKQMRITFSTSGRGSATVTAARNGATVSTIASDVDIAAGSNSVTWPMTDAKGQPLPNGNYVVTIRATGEDGSVATRQMSVVLRR